MRLEREVGDRGWERATERSGYEVGTVLCICWAYTFTGGFYHLRRLAEPKVSTTSELFSTTSELFSTTSELIPDYNFNGS